MKKKGSIYYSVAVIITIWVVDEMSLLFITFILYLSKYKIKDFSLREVCPVAGLAYKNTATSPKKNKKN